MVRFTCFTSPIHYHKSKKPSQSSADAMDDVSGCSSQGDVPKIPYSSTVSELQSNIHNINSSTATLDPINVSPTECVWKQEETDSSLGDKEDVFGNVHFRKSQSLGSGLDKEGQISIDVDENMEDRSLICDYASLKNYDKSFNDFVPTEPTKPFVSHGSEMHMLSQYTPPFLSESSPKNDDMLMPSESIFSIGDSQQIVIEVHEDFDTQFVAQHASDSGFCTSHAHSRIARIAKSCSLPDMKAPPYIPTQESPPHEFTRSKSFPGLTYLFDVRKELSGHEGEHHHFNSTFCKLKDASLSQTSHFVGMDSLYQEASLEDCLVSNQSGTSNGTQKDEMSLIFKGENHAYPNRFGCGYSCNSVDFGMQRSLSETEEIDVSNNHENEPLVHKSIGLSNKEFKSKLIEDWVNKIDLENNFSLHEEGECSSSIAKTGKDMNSISGVISGKYDAMIMPGMEAANRYISSLTAISTSAQMANLGLAVIPFLGAYSSLRTLNLSSNAIVRITAGVLPRALHVLNLSRNSLSTIEGLRELTRLRILNLSYNRIFKIGHGLASCTSLKELYLAGNKINEVEGLHRLLKLSVLDLRFNKISTAKCLGQLAANYGSLQAIDLEGNPAQKTVGDEQLKKYVVGLLPHLIHFNKQTIRNSSLKEVAERPSRSVASYQFDRSFRPEHKLWRRGNHAQSSRKLASTTSHGKLIQSFGLQNQSKSRHGRLPPSRHSGTHQQMEVSSSSKSNMVSSSQSIRRSLSEGTL